MFHDNWATENLRWRANLHSLGSNGRCADIPTHQGHVALCLVEARDGTDEWRITKNVLLNLIDLIFIFFDIVSNSEMIIINPRLWKGYSLTFRQKVTCYQYAWTHQYLFRLSQASLPGMGAVTALGSQHLGNLGTWQDSGFTMAIALLNDTVHYGQSDVNQSDSSCSSQDQTMTSGGIHDKRVCVTQNISECMFWTTFLAYHCIPVQQFALHRLPV